MLIQNKALYNEDFSLVDKGYTFSVQTSDGAVMVKNLPAKV